MLTIDRSMNDLINDELLYLNSIVNGMESAMTKQIDNAIYRVDLSINTLDKLNPIKLLKSGYSIVTHQGAPIGQDINIGDEVEILTEKDKILATITHKEDRC